MMILVSSKRFAESIKKIDLSSVRSVAIEADKYLTINFGRSEALVIPVECRDSPCIVSQENVRWDWLYRDVRAIQEQPLVIEFSDNVARFTLSY